MLRFARTSHNRRYARDTVGGANLAMSAIGSTPSKKNCRQRTSPEMHMEQRVRQQRLPRAQHTPPPLIARPPLLPTPVPALHNRGAADGRRTIAAVGIECSQCRVADLLELGAIGEPDAGGEVSVEHWGPVVPRVL
jgi:hypothetical protein